MKNESRFEAVYSEGNSLTTAGAVILAGRETGIHCLFMKSGCSGGLAPLPDKDGKPVVAKEG